MRWNFTCFVIGVALLFNCQQQPTNLKPGIITLGVIPDNSGTIHTNVNSFKVGDHIILEAEPYSKRVFFKWLGTSVSYNPKLEFNVTTQDRKCIAVFPITILADSLIFIANYPEHAVNIGEEASFDIGLNLPLDSTYTVACRCDNYDDFSFVMYAHGDQTELNVGCRNDHPIKQSNWWITVQSDKLGSTVVSERIFYDVEWK
jgi:hypothetical protein